MASMLKFISLFLQESNFNAPIEDLNEWYTRSVSGLKNYLPEPLPSRAKRQWAKKYPAVFSLIAMGAHLKSSFSEKGGHLLAENAGLFYIRIPKAGSTSVVSAMLGVLQPAINTEKLDATQLNFLADAWLRTDLNTLNAYTGFTIVRHPLARLVSVYRDIFESQEPKPFIYQNYLGGILPKDISFDEFVSRISRIPDSLKDQHLKPQNLFLKPYQKRGITVRIFSLEDTNSIVSFLKPYGLEFPHLNQSSAYSYQEYYTEKSLALAQKMYVHDFRMFNYEQKINR